MENSSTTATTNALYEPLDLLECSLEIENIFALSLSLSYACTLSRPERNTVKKFPLRVCVFLSPTLAAAIAI